VGVLREIVGFALNIRVAGELEDVDIIKTNE